jgi:hypothetical protein
VLLATLYHPEYFPLPRFPLAISDLARAARCTLTGQTELMDMQLGVTLDEITTTMATNRPDILGVSATFGQRHLLEADQHRRPMRHLNHWDEPADHFGCPAHITRIRGWVPS